MHFTGGEKGHFLSFFSFFVTLLLILSVTSPALASKPRVAVLPLDTSEAGKYSYLGHALQQMLISRLASENLDVLPASAVPASYRGSDAADFFVLGSVKEESGNRISIDLELRTPDSDTPVSVFNIKPRSLDAIVTEAGRHAIIIGQKIASIENQRVILDSISDTANEVAGSDKPIIDDEALKIARIHPDLLYREAPEDLKGTATPIDKVPEAETPMAEAEDNASAVQAEETGTATSDTATEDEDDYWQPDYPPDYEEEGQKKVKAAAKKAEEDDETWAEDYPPEYESSNIEVAGKTSSGSKKRESSWFSWLWPFGSDSAPDTRNRENRPMPKPVPEDRLPYPVPKAIEKVDTTDTDQESMQSALMASIPSIKDMEPGVPATANHPAAPASNQVPQQINEELSGRAPDVSESEAARQAQSARETASDVMSSFISSAAGDVENSASSAHPETDMETSSNATATPDATAETEAVEEAITEEMAHETDSAEAAAEDEAEQHLPELQENTDVSGHSDIAYKAGEPAETTPQNTDVAAEVANVQAKGEEGVSRISSSEDTNKNSKTGWFSWLWPASWKGEGPEASAHTAPATPAVPADKEEPEYQAASEPPPKKGSGPIWVWN